MQLLPLIIDMDTPSIVIFLDELISVCVIRTSVRPAIAVLGKSFSSSLSRDCFSITTAYSSRQKTDRAIGELLQVFKLSNGNTSAFFSVCFRYPEFVKLFCHVILLKGLPQ